jgi:hypothetical protein
MQKKRGEIYFFVENGHLSCGRTVLEGEKWFFGRLKADFAGEKGVCERLWSEGCL